MNQADDTANANKVLDFADTAGHSNDDGASALSVATGPSSSVDIDLDGDEGSLLQLAGNVALDLFGFVTLSGNFAFKTATGDFTVADGSTSTQLTSVEYLAIGASDTTGSVGVGGVGLTLSSVELAMVVVNDDDNSVEYTAVKASVGSASFTGISGLTMTVNTLSLQINQSDDDANPNKVLDFADTAGHSNDDGASALSVATGPSSSVDIDLDGDEGSLLQLAGSADLDLFGFVTLTGDFAFKTATGDFTVADGSTSTQLTAVEYMAVGGTVSTASVGIAGVGFTLNDIELAMVVVSDEANSVEYTAVKASVGSASFTGVPGLTITVNSLSLEMNQTDDDANPGKVLDFADTASHSNDDAAAPLSVATGPGSSVDIDHDGDEGSLLQLTSNADLGLFGLVTLTGNFAFKTATGNFTVADGSTSTELTGVEHMAVGGNISTASVGIAGVGFVLNDIELAMVVVSDDDNSAEYTAVKASIGSASLTGIPGLTVSVNTLSLEVNQTDDTDNPNKVLDFADTASHSNDDDASALSVATGPSSSVDIDLDGDEGSLLQLAGNVDIDLLGFITLSGDFAFKQAVTTLTLDDASEVTADMLAIGATNVTAFAGVSLGLTNRLGLELTGVELALVTLTDQADSSREWMSLQASASSLGLVGIPGITLAATDISIRVNQAADDDSLVDYGAQSLEVGTGPSDSITLTMDASEGELIEVIGNMELDVVSFVQVSGGFAFRQGPTATATLSDGSEKEVSIMTLGASSVDVFVGVDGPANSGDALGISIENVDFALAMLKPTDTNDGSSYYGLKATADSASFVGIDGFTLAVEAIDIVVNDGTDEQVTDRVIDFSAGDLDGDGDTDGETEIETGPSSSLALDASTNLISASGRMTLIISDFVHVSGNMAFNQSAGMDVTLVDGTTKTVNVLTLGASDLNVFVGSGPYFIDSNNDGFIDENDTRSPDAVGLALDNVDFAVALYSAADEDDSSKYHAVSVSATTVGLVGLGLDGSNDNFTLTASSYRVEVNGGKDGDDSEAKPAIDFSQLPGGVHTVDIGGGQSIDFDFESRLLRVTIFDALIDISGFIQISGTFTFTKSEGLEVTLDDGSTRPVDVNAFGGDGVNVFVGSGPYFIDSNNDGVIDNTDDRDEDAIGLVIENTDFGLMLMKGTDGDKAKYTALKVSSELVSFVGIDVFEFSARDVDVLLNTGSKNGDSDYQRVVDFSAFSGGSYVLLKFGQSRVYPATLFKGFSKIVLFLFWEKLE